MTTIVYEEGNIFEAAVALMCHDVDIVINVKSAPPNETLIVFIESAADLADFYGCGYKTILAVSYTEESSMFETEAGEAVTIFPVNDIFTKLPLEKGIEVASFLDNIIMKVFDGKYKPVIGDTTAAGAAKIFKAMGGQRMKLTDICIDILDFKITTAELIAQGAVVERVRHANLFRTLQAGVAMARKVPLCPGSEPLVHPDGAAPEQFSAQVLHVNYTDDLIAELDYVVEFMKGSPFDYVLSVHMLPRAAADAVESGRNYVFRSTCIRLNPAAPAGMCLVGGGEEKNRLLVFDSEVCPFGR